jgi:glycerol-3-phosphate O-acyltransferase
MFDTVSLPVWLLVIGALFAAWAVLDRLLVPSVRWMFRRRINRVLGEARSRLHIDIPPFALTKRAVLIDRLMFDAKIQEAAAEHAAEHDMPREVATNLVRRYAREIVPAFNAYFYFRLGYWFARRLSRTFYRVRIGHADDAGLRSIPPKSTPVFVINHRSNMDYVLVAFMAAERSALSYAVGEWARIWPLQSLVRMMGGFFVRRNSKNPLYRRVLERYVQMACEGGVPQAVFPEGGLSRDGLLREPKLGLLDYMLRSFDPAQESDVVFIPVGVNYDRVVEDRTLLRSLDTGAPRRGKMFAIRTVLGFLWHNVWLALRGRWFRFGYACVNFGTPISLKARLAETGVLPAQLPDDARIGWVKELADDLMDKIGRTIPVLPVALIATVFKQAPTPRLTPLELKAGAQAIMTALDKHGALTYIPRADRDYAVDVGLRMLTLRHIIEEADGFLSVAEANRPLLDYYANSIAHLTDHAVSAQTGKS